MSRIGLLSDEASALAAEQSDSSSPSPVAPDASPLPVGPAALSGDEHSSDDEALPADGAAGTSSECLLQKASVPEEPAPAPTLAGAAVAPAASEYILHPSGGSDQSEFVPVAVVVGSEAEVGDLQQFLETAESAPLGKVNLSVDDIIQYHGGGFGRFQWTLWALSGYVWMFHAMNVVSQVYVTVTIEQALDEDLSDFQLSLLGSAVFFGWLVGSLVGGVASDTWGRKPLLLWSIASSILFDVASLFIINYSYALFCRFMVGLTTGGINATVFTILLEYSDPPSRDTYLIVWHIWFTFGQIALACVGLFVFDGIGFSRDDPDGGLIVLAFIPVFGISSYILSYVFMPDSARFRLVCGDTENARALMNDMMVANTGRPLPENFGLEAVPPAESRGSLLSIFLVSESPVGEKKDVEAGPGGAQECDSGITPRHKWYMLAQWLIWFTTAMVFYGAMVRSSGEERVSLALLFSSAVEIPSCIMGMFTNKYMGRRFSTYTGLFVCTVCLVISLWLPADSPDWIGTLFANLAKFGVGITFNTVFLYVTELFPTSIRSIAAGSASAWGRFGALLAPLFIIFASQQAGEGVVLFFFASLSAVAGVVAVFLPETQGLSLQDK